MRFRAGVLLVVMAGSACGEAFSGADDARGGSAGSGGDLSKTPCTPGRSLSCVGNGQCDGFQECNDKGTGYGACHCEGALGGAPGSAGAPTSGSGGSAPSDGGDPGNPGMAGAAPAEPIERYVYWTSAGSAVVETIDGQTGEVTGEKLLAGPEAMAATGWTMRTFVPFNDGTAKSLWTTTQGVAQLWTLESNLAPVSSAAFEHDPLGTYFASTYRRLPNGTGRLIWHDNATSNTYVWPLSEQGEFLEEVLAYEPTPDGDWLPVHYTTMPDGRGLLLWVGVETGIGPTGESQAWVMPDDSQPTSFLHIQHTKEQWSRSLTQDPDGSVRIGLGSKVDGAGVVCGLAELAAGIVTVPTAAGWGPGKCKSYSRPGMQFRGYVARWQPSIGDP
jgi:hypothetical protein